MEGARKSHQTTIRFTEGLWLSLQRAADDLEVSVAQYVRDAARTRLAQDVQGAARPDSPAERMRVEADEAREHALREAESSAALWEQGRLARERSRLLRDESRERRRVRAP